MRQVQQPQTLDVLPPDLGDQDIDVTVIQEVEARLTRPHPKDPESVALQVRLDPGRFPLVLIHQENARQRRRLI
jgi:hypothetical protein